MKFRNVRDGRVMVLNYNCLNHIRYGHEIQNPGEV